MLQQTLKYLKQVVSFHPYTDWHREQPNDQWIPVSVSKFSKENKDCSNIFARLENIKENSQRTSENQKQEMNRNDDLYG